MSDLNNLKAEKTPTGVAEAVRSEQSAIGATGRIGKARWIVAMLLFTASIIAYIDRAALSVAAPFVRADLHLSPSQMGMVFSAFFAGYAIFNFIGGSAADRFGPKKTYTYAMFAWSVFCGLTVVATGFMSLLLVRVLFGAGEGPMGSVTNKSVSNWFPPKETGFVMGLTPAGGNFLGASFAGPLIAYMAIAIGWRAAFVVIMCLGLIWLVAWMIYMTDTPEENSRVMPAEAKFIREQRLADGLPETDNAPPLRQYLLSPMVLGIGFSFFASSYILFFFLTWMPTYLVDVRHLDIRSMSFANSVPWASGLLGSLLGGYFSDVILRKSGNPALARKVIVIVGLLGAAIGMAFTTQITTTTQAVSLMALVMFLAATTPLACWALVQENIPSQRVGSVGGYIHFLSNLSGVIGPTATGYIVQYIGGYNMAFAIAATIAGLAAVSMFYVPLPSARKQVEKFNLS